MITVAIIFSRALRVFLAAGFVATLGAACNGRSSSGGAGNEEALQEASRHLTAATLEEQVVLSNDEYLEWPQYRDADARRGELLVMQCRACHSVERGVASVAGPGLAGFLGRKAAWQDGYPYSPALAAADFVWTPRALDAWLANPARFLPGNVMVYSGLRNASDRDAVIAAFLRMAVEE